MTGARTCGRGIEALRLRCNWLRIAAVCRCWAVQFLIAHGADFKAFNPQTGQSLIEKGTDVNALGPDGTPPLDDAALKGQREIVELLLSHGAKVDVRNKAGATPLHDAALGGDAGVIKMLLDHRADVNARDAESGATPLYYAASWGRQEAVELLLARGADPNAKTKKGATILQAAIDSNQPEIAALLRKHGAK